MSRFLFNPIQRIEAEEQSSGDKESSPSREELRIAVSAIRAQKAKGKRNISFFSTDFIAAG